MNKGVAVVGAGLMGPAAVIALAKDGSTGQIILADRDRSALDIAAKRIERALDTNIEALPVTLKQIDLDQKSATDELFSGAAAILTALPWTSTMKAIDRAMAVGTPLVDLAIPDDSELDRLRGEAPNHDGFLLLGCGLEPGLTEIEARYLAGKFEEVNSFSIMVGGLPSEPSGPLGYKIVFGGDELPLRNIPALVVEKGEQILVDRYSGCHNTFFAGVGVVESWNEGIIPWLLDQDEMKGLQFGLQQTIRWPGYATKATVLNELGLLSTDPLEVGSSKVVPKQLVDELLRPHVTMTESDRDITLFRVEVSGELRGENITLRTEFIDRFDEASGVTSMARTTAYAGAILTTMVAKRKIQGQGVVTPDQVVTGELYTELIESLESFGINYHRASFPSGLDQFKAADGRLKNLPTKRSKRDAILDWLAAFVHEGMVFSESEMNRMLDSLHNFKDSAWLRRELVDGGWFERKADGSEYKRRMDRKP